MHFFLFFFFFVCFYVQARQLIEEANVIKVIVETVMELLRDHQDVNNRFFFLGYNSEKLSRIQIIFHDLRSGLFPKIKLFFFFCDIHHCFSLILFQLFGPFVRYILISKPTVWTAELRAQFFEGFKVFLKLLKCMQVIVALG